MRLNLIIKSLGIEGKLVLLMAFIVLAPAPLTMFAIDHIVAGSQEQVAKERIELAINAVNEALKNQEQKLTKYVNLLRRDDDIIHSAYYAIYAGERAVLFRELREVFRSLDLDELQVFGTDGVTLAGGEYFASHSLSRRNHLLVVSALADVISSGPFIDRGRCVIQAAAPLRRMRVVTSDKPYEIGLMKSETEYEIIGGLLASLYVDNALLQNLKAISGADISLVKDGITVMSTINNHVGALSTGDDEVTISSITIGDTPYESASLPVKAIDNRPAFHINALLDVSSLRSTESVTRFSLIGIMTLSLMAAVVLAFILARGIVRPIRELQQGVARVGSGDFDTPIDVVTGDELQTLARSFNKMAKDLKDAEDERRRNQAELVRRRKETLLAERHATLGRMAAHVAHEVGNPLASISSFLQMLRNRGYDSFTEEAHDTIYRSIERISTIVAQLSRYARPASEEAVCNVGETIDEMLQMLSLDKRLAQIEVIRGDIYSIPKVAADPGQLQQVFVNLTLNAAEVMQSGGQLTIDVKDNGFDKPDTLQEELEYVAVTFKDTGAGVTKEEADLIFEPYFSTKGDGDGAGIGLALSHGIVRRFNGELAVTTGSSGATFTIYLPIATENK